MPSPIRLVDGLKGINLVVLLLLLDNGGLVCLDRVAGVIVVLSVAFVVDEATFDADATVVEEDICFREMETSSTVPLWKVIALRCIGVNRSFPMTIMLA